jgi:phosphopentomutase
MGQPDGCFGKMAERSKGKDSTTGHWELMGLIVDKPFPTYPQGFPHEVIQAFEQAIGRKVLGNRASSGTDIIRALGAEHQRTGSPIVYTSADSVFQVAAHEEIIPVDDLYAMCRTARKILISPHQVARVIARPFTGTVGEFVRTPRRRDFSVDPIGLTVLDHLNNAGQPVIGIGKVDELFRERGFTRSIRTADNKETLDQAVRTMRTVPRGLLFCNLIDFDMLYGHRNDPSGFARALQEFDSRLPELIRGLGAQDCLMVTADHGNDPTTGGTDHTREYVPLLAYGPKLARGVNLGTRGTMADLGQTIADGLGVKRLSWGESFLDSLRREV